MKPSLLTRQAPRALSGAALVLAMAIPSLASAQKVPRSQPGERGSMEHRDAEPRTEIRPWLGVATSPVAPVLREHLELAEGFGIQVEYVVEGSPAEKAGITERDIFTKLDEQLLTTPEHLAVLVRSMKKGDKVTVTLIRKGAEQTVDVTLGENEVPVQDDWPRSYGLNFGPSPENPRQWQFHGQFPAPDGPEAKEWQESVREYQDQLRDWVERNHPQRFHVEPRAPRDGRRMENDTPPPAKPALPLPAEKDKPAPKKSDDEKRPGDGNGKPPALSVRPGFPIEVFSGAGLIRIDNEEGEVSIQSQDGEHSIKIVNAAGETVYEGDYDPEKGTKGLPKEAQNQLHKMKLDDLQLLGVPQGSAQPGTKTETKTEIKIQIGADPAEEEAPADTKADLL